MEFHLDRGLRLKTEIEYKNLYRWAINETDDKEQVVGRDQIPWQWSLSFTALSCELSDEFTIKTVGFRDQPLPAPEIGHRNVIRAKLRPGDPRDEYDYLRNTAYSMFGTSRVIEDFALNIHSIGDDETENCHAWGTVSYTAEVDLFEETTPDTIVFYLLVKRETFDRYRALVSEGRVNEIMLRVSSVSGFYSEWSPSISARSIKVLTSGKEHAPDLTSGSEIIVPRLGEVGEVELFMNRHLVFGAGRTINETVEHSLGAGASSTSSSPDGPLRSDLIVAINGLKRAVWAGVILGTAFCIILATRW